MKQDRLLYALNDIDDALVEDAAPGKPSKGRVPWVKLASAAACLAVVIGLFLHLQSPALTVMVNGTALQNQPVQITAAASGARLFSLEGPISTAYIEMELSAKGGITVEISGGSLQIDDGSEGAADVTHYTAEDAVSLTWCVNAASDDDAFTMTVQTETKCIQLYLTYDAQADSWTITK